MARPKKCRCIKGEPNACYFKPRGIPLMELEEAILSLDGFEALRLADLEGLHHADAAVKMGISRATFGRILRDARRTVADALINGKAIGIITPPPRNQGGSS